MSDLLFTGGSTPSTPAAGKVKIFVDSADDHTKQVDDAGSVTDLTTGAGGTDALAIHVSTDAEISGIAGKTTPVDADVAVIEDSAASNAKKSLTWANIKATLKAYFDTIYAALSHAHVPSTDMTASGTPSSSTFLRGDDSWSTPAGSGDVVGPASSTDGDVALFDGITGKLLKAATPGTAHNKAFGTTVGTVCQGNDARLSDDRDPTAHASEHTDGTDDIQSATNAVKGLATAAQITALEANTAKVTNATHTGDVTGATALTIANKVTMTATAPITVSGTPTVIAAGAVAIAIPAATASVNGYATSTQITKLDGVEASADVTDATNVAAAGAVMETRTETAGENVVAGNLCYLKTDGKYWKADASAEATASTELLLANATIAADASGEFIEYGEYTTSGLTAGSIYYVSETAAAITLTAPTTSAAIVRIIGYAKSTTVLKFKPDTSFIELA